MQPIYLGESPVRSLPEGGQGSIVQRDGEPYYRIGNFHVMPPFFMTVVSGFDHWLFVSSTGGLTCGRRDPDHALFPYTTDDKIHDASTTTGPATCFLVDDGERISLWKPFSGDATVYRMERNLYKSLEGNTLIFEEVNHDLGLHFSYSWNTGERFGFIRKATLSNESAKPRSVHVLDGFRNLLPSGVERSLQTNKSTLVDAYKQAEAVPGIAAAIFSLSSILTDRAEPNEALHATVAWSVGLDQPGVLLSEDQLQNFCRGRAVEPESFERGKRGAFFVVDELRLSPESRRTWYMGADVGLGPAAVPGLLGMLRRGLAAEVIEDDIQAGTRRLRELVGRADGFQATSDGLVTGRHFSNTLFNIMRGGVFDRAYLFPVDDFLDFVDTWHAPLRETFAAVLASAGREVALSAVLEAARRAENPDMERLVLEYLPLTFSRRHGDPSRPWNHFSIEVRQAGGSNSLGYQGNWRDIFQNWEALALSYPEFVESFVTKFVNASTPDGFNAYRISKDGFEWEIFDPHDPWSNIGYWGDHQVGYLYRLLDLSCRFNPGVLEGLLGRDIFVYADVPYRIKPYQEQITDPRNTIEYDEERATAIQLRVEALGSDGQLVTLGDGALWRVNLLEKLLVPMLGKISNLVPGGGIWMNTQRPEWNDANNALVGYGVSMVTLCYLRAYTSSFRGLLKGASEESYPVSSELVLFLQGLEALLSENTTMLAGPVTDGQRKAFMDAAGQLSETWRASLYAGFSGQRSTIEVSRLVDFLDQAMCFLDHSIALNHREDGLFQSYNLVHFDHAGFSVEPLEEMLEGQVAVLSSGFLEVHQSLELLNRLRGSALYRNDQQSYLLYPDRNLPLFQEKNIVPRALLEGFALVQDDLRDGVGRYLERDPDGNVHFKGAFRNVSVLRKTLERDSKASTADVERLCQTYEAVFDHRRFKGRSGSMYKYEGLGCIYWHMVSKLALAVAEISCMAKYQDSDDDLVDGLVRHYTEIREGLGVHKSPAEYGAFTTDPYSHTPGSGGVQQPGLTGQVKEDVITRFSELGVSVAAGRVRFAPVLLGQHEFLKSRYEWRYCLGGAEASEVLEADSLAFCLCGTPVVYRLAETASVEVLDDAGNATTLEGNDLGPRFSRSLIQREGLIRKIRVDVPRAVIR